MENGVWPATCGPDPGVAGLSPEVAFVGTEPVHGCANAFSVFCDAPWMARKARQDYPGAVHHVFVRGVERSAIAKDAPDYERALHLLERAVSRFEFLCHAWCLLPNHAHLLVTSQQGNISRAMHWMGTCTAQAFNHRYARSGHLYQGRFGSRLVEDDPYFLELVRYLALNPVRAGLCRTPGDWPWSSYASTAGLRPAPSFVDADAFLGLLGSTEAYVAWVAQGFDTTVLDEGGARRPRARASLADLMSEDSDRSIASAHFRHGYSQAEIARHLGVNRSQISRRLARHD
jgi:REP element-mobilizing transposase RayT